MLLLPVSQTVVVNGAEPQSRAATPGSESLCPSSPTKQGGRILLPFLPQLKVMGSLLVCVCVRVHHIVVHDSVRVVLVQRADPKGCAPCPLTLLLLVGGGACLPLGAARQAPALPGNSELLCILHRKHNTLQGARWRASTQWPKC